MDNDFSQCLLLNTVMAARAMTRRYDDKLRPFGVSVVQFSVLGVVRNSKESAVSAMAERIAMDRTTLLRNLDLLVRRGLIEDRPAKKGNGRIFTLTREGNALLDRIIPEWQKAQIEIRALLNDQNGDALLGALRILTQG